jgi:type I restriction enzyme, S subunit
MSGKYQAYPEYKNSGVEWLGDVPSHWQLTRVKHVAELTPKKPPVDRSLDCSFIPMEKLKTDSIVLDENKLIDSVYDGYTYFADGDILMAKVTPCFENKNIAIAKGLTNQIGFGSSEIYTIRAGKKVNNRFLFYRLQEDGFMDLAIGAMTGAGGLKRVPSDIVSNYTYATPESKEADKIANFLDHETAKIDTLIEKQQQLIALLKEKRQAVISHAVTKGLNANAPMRDSGVEWLGDVPEHWDVAKVKYFATIQGGYAFSSGSFQESGVQLLRIGNVYLNRLALERQPTFVDKAFVKSHKSFSVVRGDILMSLTGTLGKTDYGFAVHVDEDGPFMLNQRVAKITPINSKIAPEYLIYAIRSESYLKQLYSLPSGTKQANLSNDDVTNIPIVVPPTLKEQQLVAQYISDNLEKYNKVIEKSEAAIKLIQERRTALISAAVTGKIDVRDFNPKNAETC